MKRIILTLIMVFSLLCQPCYAADKKTDISELKKPEGEYVEHKVCLYIDEKGTIPTYKFFYPVLDGDTRKIEADTPIQLNVPVDELQSISTKLYNDAFVFYESEHMLIEGELIVPDFNSNQFFGKATLEMKLQYINGDFDLEDQLLVELSKEGQIGTYCHTGYWRAIETRRDLSRGVSEADYEKTIVGPKDAFIEHYNTNLGLIRRRIKDINLHTKTYYLGKYTKTKVGIIYIKGICKNGLVKDIEKELESINIDAIIDSNYLKRYLNTSKSLFPTIKGTERPDLASLSLLEGKVLIITDNSPEVLILPTFFIDFFHTSDDYYQKAINISFIRFIRLIAFILAIFLPAIYIAITTHNPDSIPINILLSFQSQRLTVPFPAFVEAIIMIVSFEILRESDIRIPSSMGTAISILGGLVLGEAAVSAGIISPIMIIIVAISAISGMLMQSIEAINSIRWYRFTSIILASIFGYYGIFLGIILILTTLSDTKSENKDYLYPFSPINFKEQQDGFIKTNIKGTKYRNPILSNNHIRGK